MKEIIINDNEIIRGEVVVSNKVIEGPNGKEVVTEGVAKVLEYVSLDKISTEGFTLSGIQVYSETFSTEEKYIVMGFIADEIEIHDEVYFDDGEEEKGYDEFEGYDD